MTKDQAIALYAAALVACQGGRLRMERLNVAYQQAIDLGATEDELTAAAQQALQPRREPAP